jgi:hypothetical protein
MTDEPVRRKRILHPRVDAAGNPLPPPPPEPPKPESRRARQKRLKRKPGRPRDPSIDFRFDPSQEQRDLVKLLAGYGIPNDRIARVIRNPASQRHISASTLERRFVHELETGAIEMDAICCGMLSKKIREGNIVAIIWYMKNKMGWSDHNVVERRGGNEVDVTIKIDPDVLADELTRRNLPLSVFGIDKPAPLAVVPKIESAADAGPYDALADASDEPEETDDARRERQFRADRMQAHIRRKWSN